MATSLQAILQLWLNNSNTNGISCQLLISLGVGLFTLWHNNGMGVLFYFPVRQLASYMYTIIGLVFYFTNYKDALHLYVSQGRRKEFQSGQAKTAVP